LVSSGFVQTHGAESLFSGGDGGLHSVKLDVAAGCCLDAGKRHVKAHVVQRLSGFAGKLGRGVAGDLLLNLREGEQRGVGRSVRGEDVHPGAAWVGQAEQLGYLVVGFAGRVVERLANVAVLPCLLWCAGREIEMRVAAAYDQREERRCLREHIVHQNSVDMAFEMVDGDQWEIGTERERLGEADADQQSAGEAWAFGNGDGGEIGVDDTCPLHGFADNGDDGAEVLA